MNLIQAFVLGIVGTVFGILTAAVIGLITGTVGYVLWNFVGPEYFSFLPKKYLEIPWINMVILTYPISFIGSLFRGSTSSSS